MAALLLTSLLVLYSVVVTLLYIRSVGQRRALYRREAEALTWVSLEKEKRRKAEEELEERKDRFTLIQGGKDG